MATGGIAPPAVQSCFRIASLTKPLTSAATVQVLRERGVPLSTPAVELLPSLAPDWAADRRITVEHLLNQVAGLRPTVEGAMMAAFPDTDDAVVQGARLVVQAGSEHPPGERWAYYNGNYFVLGAILCVTTGLSYEESVIRTVLRPWGLGATGFTTPVAPVDGWDGASPVPPSRYPRARRPSGGLWSGMGDLLTFAEHLMADAALLEETRRVRTPPTAPTPYGLGWAIGPSGQMYLNGRLPGYRAAAVVLPDVHHASFALANQEQALPELARILSRLQHPHTGEDLSFLIEAFAA